MILGDFNSHNTIWGSTHTNIRGRILESFAEENGLSILNSGAKTRVEYNTESCLDITFVTPRLESEMEWTVTAAPRDSDHLPIVVKLMNKRQRTRHRERRNMKKADWLLYRESEAWRNIEHNISNRSNEEIMKEFYMRLERAAEAAIPTVNGGKFFPKPFWNDRLRQTRETRERLYRKYDRIQSSRIIQCGRQQRQSIERQ